MVGNLGSTLRALLVATLLTNSNALVSKRQATYTYFGCRTDSVQARVLTGKATAYDTMTLQSCAADCVGFTYYGTEYGRECFCGNTLAATSLVAAEADCNFNCAGNAAQKCGAGDRLSIYKLGTGTGSSSSVTTTTTRSSTTVVVPPTTTTTTTRISTTTTTAAPVATGFPAGWTSQGCWVDGANGRILAYALPASQTLTLQSCVAACASAGYEIAGAEWSIECYCGYNIDNGGVKAASDAECNMPCSGNANQMCGAGGRLSLYSSVTPQAVGAQKTNLPAGWTYVGCLQDNIKAFSNPQLNVPTFPYKVWNSQTNDATSCLTRCMDFGFTAAGVEYGEECYCGDPSNIMVPAVPNDQTDPRQPSFFSRASVPAFVPEAQCNFPCPGNLRFRCGAGNLLSYYTYTGTTAKPFLYKWSYPTGVNAGSYSDLIGGKTVPLITGQAINGKIAFVEKGGTGLANGTGAYELDPTQTGNPALAWREMAKFETDVFCAAGLTLPDRKGRQLTVGGWALGALRGLRLWTPDGSPGVQGTSQWQEDAENVQIQRPRWYPSALIMANGSILVIGGEIGNNDLPEPTAELLPPTGGGTVYLDFLQRTWPDNLYPFVAVLPSGIFIAYLNEARILNPTTFATIKTLPLMQGSVISGVTSGRTYSLEGAMVLLPQYAPYNTPSGVLICGGSTSGNPEAVAIDNCVSTFPEAANPVWTLERMPSKRVLPCIAGLPDGTYLIANGAAHGVAGFGRASSPNLNAVLYDPTKPVHTRMSLMANTTVARLYHSEAITMLDGRVLITGSDPTGAAQPGPESFPNEFRVEVFTPPYLLSGIARPTFTITNKDWAYNANVAFTVAGSTADIRVSLLGSVVSTHGNAMGQRTIFPAVSCAGQTCTVTAPPNGGVAPPGWFMMFVLRGATPSQGVFVRIGGDPASLGNWPANSAEFTKPGIGPI